MGLDVVMYLSVLVHVDGLVQERRNFTANALELRLSCICMYVGCIHGCISELDSLATEGYGNTLKLQYLHVLRCKFINTSC